MPRKPASDDPSLARIAANLRRIRVDLKLRQGDVEDEAHLPKGQLSRWERGHAKPEVDAVLRLAAAYHCSVDELLIGVYEPYDEAIIEQEMSVTHAVTPPDQHSGSHHPGGRPDGIPAPSERARISDLEAALGQIHHVALQLIEIAAVGQKGRTTAKNAARRSGRDRKTG